MVTLDLFNHAGGAGKASLTYALAFEFARRGRRVLAIDLDPQSSLTKISDVRVQSHELARTVHDTAVDDAPLPEPAPVHNFHLIPSHLNLTLAEGRMLGVLGAQMHLRNRLGDLEGRFDLVLIDSPPSLGQLAVLGALASDALVVPLPTEDKGAQGLDGLRQALAQYHKVRRDLHVALYVPNQYDRRVGHHRDTLDLYRSALKPLATELPNRSVWLDAWRAKQPVGAYAPGSEADQAVQRLADEVTTAAQLPEATHG